MKRLFVFLALLSLGIGVASAQGLTTGTLEGNVSDKDGAAIADAIVTVMGPQGVQTTDTKKSGNYTVRGLVSGTYKVKVEAAGYAAVVQSEVNISINTSTQLPFVLDKSHTEEITVVSQAPIVDMKSTGTGENIRVDDLVGYVPIGRNLVSVFTIAPGVSDGGDPVLGNTNSSISGSSGLENAYFVDGVNITNSGYGALGAYSIVYGSLGSGVTYDFLEEVQVKTGGFEAEFGQAGGGIVNSVVRTGTNDFGFDIAWYEEPSSLEGSRSDRVDFPDIANQIESTRRDISLSVNGPIVKDKLFYFAAYNPITIEQDFKLTSGGLVNSVTGEENLYDLDGDGVSTDSFATGQTISGGRTPASVTRERTIDNYAGKISWFATPNHKIEVTAFGDPSEGEVGAQSPTTFLRNLTQPALIPDPETGATGLDWGGEQLAAKYQGVWTPNFFTEFQYSTKKNEFSEIGPGVNFRSFFDVAGNATFGGAGFYEELSDDVTQINFKNTHVFGPVEFSYGYQSEEIEWAQPRLRSGDTYTGYFPNLVDGFNDDGTAGTGFAPGCVDPTTVVGNTGCYTPVQSSTGATVDILAGAPDIYNVTRTVFTEVGQPTDATDTAIFAQANWDIIPSLTLKVGLRWGEQELTGSGNETLPLGELDDGTAVGGQITALTAQSYKFDSELAPRIGIAWDVAGNGKHKVYANWGQYFQRVPSDLAVRAFSNEVGTTDEEFLDGELTNPNLNNSCGFDSDGDGDFDSFTLCHVVNSVQGLAGGGSIILDGTQQDPDSDVYAALGGLNTLTSAEATKMPYTEEFLVGYAYEVNDHTGVEVRYITREVGRALEDVQFASNEQTWNLFWGESGGNPSAGDPFDGHGTGAFGAYVFANVGGNVDTRQFPVPVRDYEAIEFVFDRRFNGGWMAYANYRYAQLEGNYEGSFRNDNGQSDPFLTSLFDFPAASAIDTDLTNDANGDGDLTNDFDTDEGDFIRSDTLFGQYISGPLNTQRAHIFNGFLSRQFDFGLNIGGRVNIQTGQPRGPLFAHPTYRNSGEVPGFNPIYWWGVDVDTTGDGAADSTGFYTNVDATLQEVPAGSVDIYGNPVISDGGDEIQTGPRLFAYDFVKRDFFGETPATVTFDLSFSYDWAFRSGKSKVTLLLDIFNLFGDNSATRFDNSVETRPGAPNVDFLKATGYQGPRNVRIGAKFSW